jgi:NADH:ubiquinone oxidoreductase subunit F (NADH-binding)
VVHGGIFSYKHLDVPIDYGFDCCGAMMGSGGMIIMDEDDCMVDVAKYFLDFTVDESCGKCTPCRVAIKAPQC